MYSLVVLLSILASASFVLAFVRGDRRARRRCSALWLALLLYTHTWGLFLAAAMAVAWLVLWRRGRGRGPRRRAARRGARADLRAVAADRRLPGRAHRGAVGRAAVAAAAARHPGRAVRPLRGAAAGARRVLRAAAPAAGRPRRARAGRDRDRHRRPAPGCARRSSPRGPTRYLAVLLGPLLLALASVVSRGTRWTAVALAGVAVVWLMSGPPPIKSNVRTVSTGVAPSIRPGDLVVSTQPEQVPALYRYLPQRRRLPDADGARLRPAPDRLARRPRRACAPARPRRELLPVLDRLDRGKRILIVTPGAGQRALAGAVEPRRPDPHARVARGAAGERRGCGRSATSRRSRGARTRCARSSTKCANESGRAGGRRGRSAARRPCAGP